MCLIIAPTHLRDYRPSCPPDHLWARPWKTRSGTSLVFYAKTGRYPIGPQPDFCSRKAERVETAWVGGGPGMTELATAKLIKVLLEAYPRTVFSEGRVTFLHSSIPTR